MLIDYYIGDQLITTCADIYVRNVKGERIEADYTEIVKSMFIIPVVDQYVQDFETGMTAEELVDAIYDSWWHDNTWFYEIINEGIAEVMISVFEELGIKPTERRNEEFS